MAKHIIVIDDSQTVCKIFEGALGQEEYQVICFLDPVSAIRAIRTQRVIPDLLFVDIELPIMSGYEVIKQIRAHATGKSIPIVVVSRYAGVIDRLKSRLAGAVAHLAKPFTLQELIMTVQQYVS